MATVHDIINEFISEYELTDELSEPLSDLMSKCFAKYASIMAKEWNGTTSGIKVKVEKLEDPALAQSLEQLTKNCTSVVLNEFCRNNGLRVGGNKSDICSRVWRKLQGESSSEDESPRNKPKKSKKTSEKHKCSACTSKGLPCGSSATEQVGELWYCLRHISAASTSEVVEVEVDEPEPELEAEPAPKKKSKIPKPGKKKV